MPQSASQPKKSKLNSTAFKIIAQILMISFCVWIIVHGNLFVLLFLILPAAIISMLLASVTLFLSDRSAMFTAIGLVGVVNIVGFYGENVDRIIQRNSAIQSENRLAEQMANFTPTHYVSDDYVTIQFRPKTSTSPGLDKLSYGHCVQLIELFVSSSAYSRVIIPNVDRERFIYAPRLTRLAPDQACDANHQLLR